MYKGMTIIMFLFTTDEKQIQYKYPGIIFSCFLQIETKISFNS